jgi:hypothetical protein
VARPKLTEDAKAVTIIPPFQAYARSIFDAWARALLPPVSKSIDDYIVFLRVHIRIKVNAAIFGKGQAWKKWAPDPYQRAAKEYPVFLRELRSGIDAVMDDAYNFWMADTERSYAPELTPAPAPALNGGGERNQESPTPTEQAIVTSTESPTPERAGQPEISPAPTADSKSAPPTIERESEKAERKRLRDKYKAECRAVGVKVTDEMIAKAANPKWTSRTNIQKWLGCDPKYSGEANRLIRKVLIDTKPHLREK